MDSTPVGFFRVDVSAPTGSQYEQRIGIGPANVSCKIPAGHASAEAQVRDHEVEALFPECNHRIFAAQRGYYGVTVVMQDLLDECEDRVMVINSQNVSWLSQHPLGRQGRRSSNWITRRRQGDAKCRPSTGRRLDRDGPVMLLDDTEDHGQPEARTTRAFRREERLEHSCTNLLRHTDTIIGDFDLHRVLSTSGFESQGPAIREGIYGVEDQIRECLAQRVRLTQDRKI